MRVLAEAASLLTPVIDGDSAVVCGLEQALTNIKIIEVAIVLCVMKSLWASG
jgi:hypothetical protein